MKRAANLQQQRALVPKEPLVAYGRKLPACWTSVRPLRNFFATPTVDASVRMHWFADGAVESACLLHRRDHIVQIETKWSETMTLCPRCCESFSLVGKAIPPFTTEHDEGIV